MIHRKRIIPVLLIHQDGLIKSKRFKDYTYVGDPINAVRIFNDKEVDEIIILDIDASKKGRGPNFDFIAEITGEAFMPLAYGGGITQLEEAEKLFYNGVEKIILNTILHISNGFDLVQQIANRYGTQSVIASVDIIKNFFGQQKVYNHSTGKNSSIDILDFCKRCQDAGCGEIMLNSVSNDGMYSGYDINLLSSVANQVDIPVIICGGASSVKDFRLAEENGASAMAAGSMFVFQRPHNAVLISYDV
ncbi:MAG: AglZ/HisF2 family acetamidino modification protein [Bacteroidia bacterium]|nr:AglZ/HisF2 family acetamidino modification protein [Bacteroidia bacterium]